MTVGKTLRLSAAEGRRWRREHDRIAWGKRQLNFVTAHLCGS
jgi:hypothetical protein